MSLFKWSTPERRVGDRILPVIPNEIYLHILGLILPAAATGRGKLLPYEAFKVLAKLSLVCRLFANVCLPPIFEFLEFSGKTYNDHKPYSPGPTLCEQVRFGESFALSLAQCVKMVHSMDWYLGGYDSRIVRECSREFTAGVAYMKNLRQLTFSQSFVEMDHWNAILALPALEKVSFEGCRFFKGPAECALEHRLKCRVPHLQVKDSTATYGDRQAAAAVDPQSLRALTMDIESPMLDYIHWPPECNSFKELHLCKFTFFWGTTLHAMLRKVPSSLEVLSLPAPILGDALAPGIFRDDFWEASPNLRSVTFNFSKNVPPLADILSYVLQATRPIKSLQVLTLSANGKLKKISATQVQEILHNSKELDAASSLEQLGIFGIGFKLVDGKWITGVAL